jgi:hypothetical protein
MILVFQRGPLNKITLHGLFCKIHAESSREIFMEFDPAAVSKINEKKLVAPGSTAHSLLSEQKLRAVLENARQILKVGSACLIYCQFGTSVGVVFCLEL